MKNRIRELRRGAGLTLQRLADLVGTTAQQINRLERGDRRLTTEWMERIAGGLEVHPAELIDAAAGAAPRGAGGGPGADAAGAFTAGARDLPVYGTARGGSDALLFNDGEILERLPRPELLSGATQAYAVYMTGDSMEPRYEALELLYVNPARPVTRGCYVVVQKRNGEAIVKRLVSRNDHELVLSQLNPPLELRIPAVEVVAVHRVVGSVEHG
jgi:phage repressor protein C with HTH and peptisase S24 domain